MAKHSRAAVAAAWVQAGGNPAKVREAVAVAECESGLDDSASSFCCHGVWQLHQDYYDPNCARQLMCSTRQAVKTSKNGTDWSAWDCHPDSRSRTGPLGSADTRYASIFDDLGDSFKNQGNPLGPLFQGPEALGKGAEALGIDLGPFLAIPAFFKGLGELMLTPEGWVRIGKIGGGTLLIIWGLRVIVKQSTGTDPIGTAKKAGEAVALAVAAKKAPIP